MRGARPGPTTPMQLVRCAAPGMLPTPGWGCEPPTRAPQTQHGTSELLPVLPPRATAFQSPCVMQVEHTLAACSLGSTQPQRAEFSAQTHCFVCSRKSGFLQDTPSQNGKAISLPIKKSTSTSCSPTVQPQMLPKFSGLSCSPCVQSRDFHLFTAVCSHRSMQYCSNDLHWRWKGGKDRALSNNCTGPTAWTLLRQGLSSFPNFSPCSQQESHSLMPDTWATCGG